MTDALQRTPGPDKSGVHLRTVNAGVLGLLIGLVGGFFFAREWPVAGGPPQSGPADSGRKEVGTASHIAVIPTKRDRGPVPGRAAASPAPEYSRTGLGLPRGSPLAP